MVKKVKRRAITVPANDYNGPLSTDHYAVTLTLINTSGSTNMYSTGDFYAISNQDQGVRQVNFGPGVAETVWLRTDLSPGGRAEIIIMFPITYHLSTLALTTPRTSQQITTSPHDSQ